MALVLQNTLVTGCIHAPRRSHGLLHLLTCGKSRHCTPTAASAPDGASAPATGRHGWSEQKDHPQLDCQGTDACLFGLAEVISIRRYHSLHNSVPCQCRSSWAVTITAWCDLCAGTLSTLICEMLCCLVPRTAGYSRAASDSLPKPCSPACWPWCRHMLCPKLVHAAHAGLDTHSCDSHAACDCPWSIPVAHGGMPGVPEGVLMALAAPGQVLEHSPESFAANLQVTPSV